MREEMNDCSSPIIIIQAIGHSGSGNFSSCAFLASPIGMSGWQAIYLKKVAPAERERENGTNKLRETLFGLSLDI